MEILIGIIIGAVFILAITRKPLTITIKHETISNEKTLTDEQLRTLEKTFFKQDPNLDDEYKNMGVDIDAIKDIMEGSDR